MNTSVIQIEWLHIGIALLPMLPVVALMFVWSERGWMSLYSIARMLLQLIAIGKNPGNFVLFNNFSHKKNCSKVRAQKVLYHHNDTENSYQCQMGQMFSFCSTSCRS